METLQQIVTTISNFIWSYVLIILLCGTGIYFTLRLRFVQIRKFGAGIKSVFGGFSLNGERANKDGMSSFQSLTTAIASQVGTGNITGAAVAIASGGPGSVFWMWVSAFLGMATIYAEATLAQKYKKRIDGEVTGGPVYYIREAYKGKFGKFLATFFSIAIIIALGFTGNMVQANSIGSSFNEAFGVSPLVVGIIVAIMAAFIFLGGADRIASVTEKLVPIMALFYITGSLIIIFLNFGSLGTAFKQIFVLAFKPQAIAGGVAGVTIKNAIYYGMSKGLFSNEAGMGSTPHAHARAKVDHPCDQGIVAIIGVFNTFIILTLTSLVIITTGSVSTGLSATPLAQYAFSTTFGSFGNIFIAICMLFFAFSTIIGWYFFGEVNVKYLFGNKAVKIYSALVVVAIVIGSTLNVDFVWSLSDMFNGLMVIPNLLGVLALSKVVSELTKEHDKRK